MNIRVHPPVDRLAQPREHEHDPITHITEPYTAFIILACALNSGPELYHKLTSSVLLCMMVVRGVVLMAGGRAMSEISLLKGSWGCRVD
jgi:hypothetical protein